MTEAAISSPVSVVDEAGVNIAASLSDIARNESMPLHHRNVSVRFWGTGILTACTWVNCPTAYLPEEFLPPHSTPSQSIFTLIEKRDKKKKTTVDKTPAIETLPKLGKRKCTEKVVVSDSPNKSIRAAIIHDDLPFDSSGRARVGHLQPVFSLPRTFYKVYDVNDEPPELVALKSGIARGGDGIEAPVSMVSPPSLDQVEMKDALKRFWTWFDEQNYFAVIHRNSISLREIALLNSSQKDSTSASLGAPVELEDESEGSEGSSTPDGSDGVGTRLSQSGEQLYMRLLSAIVFTKEDDDELKRRTKLKGPSPFTVPKPSAAPMATSSANSGPVVLDHNDLITIRSSSSGGVSPALLSAPSSSSSSSSSACRNGISNGTYHHSSAHWSSGPEYGATEDLSSNSLLSLSKGPGSGPSFGRRAVVELLEAGLLEIEALDDVVDALGSDADRRREDDAMSAQIRTAKKTLSEVERSCNAIIAPLRRRITRPEVVQEGERAKRKHDSDKAILSKWQKLRRSLSAVKAMPPAKYASGK